MDQKGASKAVTQKTVQKTEKKTEPLVYYVGAESLRLYENAGALGSVIVVLEQYQKVYRYKIENDFARVKVDGTGMTGWVEYAKLIRDLPQPSVADPLEHSPERSSSPSDKEMEMRTREGEMESTSSPEPASQSVDPSVFDAF